MLGGQRFACDDCGYERYVYYSCRHRACPKCQTQARQEWLKERQAELLPVPYFHLVFTLPHDLNPLLGWNEKNQRALLNLLFQAASRTLLEFGESRLHGTLGLTLVLHTWTQQLQPHYHVHGVVPAGALAGGADDGTATWQVAGRKFLFPVHALSRVFRAKYVAGFQALLNAGEVDLPPHLAGPLSAPGGSAHWIRRHLLSQSWVVYSQAPFGGPAKVLEYLSRYTHRTAISNERILGLRDGQVCFRWRDRRHDDALRSSVVPALEFVRRFAQHILPTGFQRIRHYGLLANRGKSERLDLCRRLLGAVAPSSADPPQTAAQWLETVCGLNATVCPCCQAPLQVTTLPRELLSQRPPQETVPMAPRGLDSS
ncbi:MAG: hypothetical protein JWN70_2224 [Planctomycetaceae bacterium]|nr:hypothetical protein [Planctomycetaceae bacterium]